MPAWLVLLLATATGMTVASIYYCQPLLEAIRASLGLSVTVAGLAVTASQVGYAIGLVLLVPLGDLVERRRLVVAMTLGIAAALLGIGFSFNGPMLLCMSVVVGALSVVAQVLVAFSADLARDLDRGRVVGTVMSGLLIGVLSARTASGLIAQILGWRAVFWLASASMLAVAFAMRRGLPFKEPNVKSGYRAVLRSMTAIFWEEPILRLRSLYGAIAFGIFSTLWTPLAFLLSKPPFDYQPGIIGFFGLAGLAGASAASAAGRLADRGRGSNTTLAAVVFLIVSWLPIWLGGRSVLLLIAGIILADLAIQAMHITNQSEIYRLRPEARSRLTAAYMACFFSGGVVGSSVSALAYERAGWTGVCGFGAALGVLAAIVWALKGNRGRSPFCRQRAT